MFLTALLLTTVVVVLAPWNFPADEILLLALPALVAGNTVIVKPSEVAPATGQMVVDALASALPAGVVQVAQGDGSVGARLVNGAIDMVAMTGSSETGRRIMATCAASLKRLVLELGGKDPMIIFADADLDKAAHDAVFFSLFNCGQVYCPRQTNLATGGVVGACVVGEPPSPLVFYFRLGRNVLLAQVCCSVERIYVDVAVKDEFEKKVVELAKSYTVGPGLAPGSKVGPMVSGMQRDAVAAQVEAALKDGARLLYRSSVPSTEGNWFPVTVLSSLRQSMAIQTCETFGPVVSLASFDGSEAEAVRLANDTEYGLAAYVYTTDPRRAQRVAAGIKAGQVGINCYTMTNAHLECPWVGHKGSGMGYHSGADGWRQFSLPKSVVFDQSIPAPLTVFSSL